MKRIVIIAALVLSVFLISGTSFGAQRSGMQVDGTISLATETFHGYSATFGLGVGLSIDITDRMHFPDKRAKLQLRGDISYYGSDDDVAGFDVSSKRMPVFLGGRYFIPQGQGNVDIYVEGGLEVSFDHVETVVPPVFVPVNSSETNIGLAAGAGLEFPLENNLVFGLNARLHMITDSYISAGASLGIKF